MYSATGESMSESHANKYRDIANTKSGLSICSTTSLSDDVLMIQAAVIISAKIRKEDGDLSTLQKTQTLVNMSTFCYVKCRG